MRNPYPRPRRVKSRGSYLVINPAVPRPEQAPSAALVPAPTPEPTFRFELERAPEDRYNGTKYWGECIVVTVNAANQVEALEKAKKISGSPPNPRYLYTFRAKSVSEV